MVDVGGSRARAHFYVKRHGKIAHPTQLNSRGTRAKALHPFCGVVNAFGGPGPERQVPIQLHAGFALRQSDQVRRFRVLEFPVFVVGPHRGPKGIFPHNVAQLHQKEAAHGVGRNGIRKIDVVEVCRGGEGLLGSAFAQCQVSAQGAEVRIQFVFARQHVHDFVLREGGKALVHPGVGLFVGAQHSVEPGVAGFVRKEPQKSFVLIALGQHQGGHGVLHAAVTALNDAELRVGVGAKFFGHEGKK